MVNVPRRAVLIAGPGAGLAILGLPQRLLASVSEPEVEPSGAWPGFPQQEARLVREVVGAAHRDEARVRSLVDARPALANAWWDWGFGDWESPLGAAAHTGRRSIAEYLISKGARVDIFAAAMLGWSDVVRAMVAASPGVQGTPGPHAISLAAHARAGGPQAEATVKLLEDLGGADSAPALAALAQERREQLAGTYAYGQQDRERFVIRVEKERLEFLAPGGTPLRLHHLGSDEFFPAGVPTVRLRFTGASASGPDEVAIQDHDRRVAAKRVKT